MLYERVGHKSREPCVEVILCYDDKYICSYIILLLNYEWILAINRFIIVVTLKLLRSRISHTIEFNETTEIVAGKALNFTFNSIAFNRTVLHPVDCKHKIQGDQWNSYF